MVLAKDSNVLGVRVVVLERDSMSIPSLVAAPYMGSLCRMSCSVEGFHVLDDAPSTGTRRAVRPLVDELDAEPFVQKCQFAEPLSYCFELEVRVSKTRRQAGTDHVPVSSALPPLSAAQSCAALEPE
jgi:hypothetical protein